MVPRINLTGQVFGDLIVIRLSDRRNKYNTLLWECLCSCGNTIYVLGGSLRAGYYKSCGCKHATKRHLGMIQHLTQDRVNGTRKTALTAKLHKDNQSGHKGVVWVEKRQKWRAYIGIKGKQVNLGYYAKKEDAIAARIKAEETYHRPYIEALEEKKNE